MARPDDDDPTPRLDGGDAAAPDADGGEVVEPPDTTSDSGVVGGVDEPNESTDALVDPTVPPSASSTTA